MKLLIYMFVYLFSITLWADSLSERVISSGARSGKKLIDEVRAYKVAGESKNEKVHIPPDAINEAFDFFDRYAGTSRQYRFLGINPHQTKPGVQYLGGEKSATGPTIGNRKYMAIFDLNLHSSLRRLHIINLETGEVESFEAAHGLESDCGGRKAGFACKFVSDRDSDASPLGFFQTGKEYNSEKHGEVLTLNGLEGRSSTFSGNDVPSSIVIHSASYVYSGHAGRSNGCPAVSESNISTVLEKLKGGSLFYFYHNKLDEGTRSPIVSGLHSEGSDSSTLSESED